MVKVSIQLVNYNAKKYLATCLNELFKDIEDAPFAYEVLVLDNHSDDDLSDLEQLYEKRVTFFKSAINLGFGGGHNFLAEKATGEYLLLLNTDLRFVQEKTIERLVKSITMNTAQVVGPKLIKENGQVQRWDHGDLTGARAKVAISFGEKIWLNQKSVTKVAWVSGAVFLIEKSIFDIIGRFDENYFLYKEEEDLCLRIRQANGIIVYDPSITVLHIGSVVAKKSKFMNASKKYYKQKNILNK